MNFIYDPPKAVDQAYLNAGGKRCPYCNTEDIEEGESHELSTEVSCKNGHVWLECHAIVGILLHEPWR